MKVSISDLMQRIAMLEDERTKLVEGLRYANKNIKTQEINGTNVGFDLTKCDDFDERFNRYMKIIEIIPTLKGIIDQKNNDFKLNNGLTIKQAILQNQYYRSAVKMLDILSEAKNSTDRFSNSGDSYYEITTLAYEPKVMKEKAKEIREKLLQTESEITKLNSVPFEVNDNLFN